MHLVFSLVSSDIKFIRVSNTLMKELKPCEVSISSWNRLQTCDDFSSPISEKLQVDSRVLQVRNKALSKNKPQRHRRGENKEVSSKESTEEKQRKEMRKRENMKVSMSIV